MKATKTKNRIKQTVHRHIKLAVVPHKANQYRPHLIRRHGLVGLLFLVIVMQAGYNFAVTGTVLGEKTTVTTEALLEDTNSERAKHRLQPLMVNERLSRAALLKGQDMLRQQYWAHTAPDGTTPWQWFKMTGYNYGYAGENLAKNFSTTGGVMAAWMSSPEHEANILGKDYSEVGFAVVNGTLNDMPTTLVVALYGAPASVVSATLGVQKAASALAEQPMGFVTRLGLAIQSITPAALGAVVVLLLAAVVALAAHASRDKLPKKLRQSWYRHHGLMKVGGMLSLCLIVVLLHAGGQI